MIDDVMLITRLCYVYTSHVNCITRLEHLHFTSNTEGTHLEGFLSCSIHAGTSHPEDLITLAMLMSAPPTNETWGGKDADEREGGEGGDMEEGKVCYLLRLTASSSVKKVMACPGLPARPVRPEEMVCRWCQGLP